jgi:hypothetical protein
MGSASSSRLAMIQSGGAPEQAKISLAIKPRP